MRCILTHHGVKVLTLIVCFSTLVSGILLNGKCDVDANCGTLDSYCKNGTCTCSEEFTTYEDSCVKVITPKKECHSNADCKFRTRTMCVRGTCTCRAFHHEENEQCIKSRVLDEPCDKDFHCYWGEKMKNTVACVDGKCSCKPGYIIANYKKCVAVPAMVNNGSSRASIMFFIPLLFCIKLILIE